MNPYDSLGKQTGSEVIFDSDPQQLIKRLLQRFQSPNYECACKPESCCCGPESKPCDC